VTPDGDTVIAYVARLGWSGLALGYASILDHRGGQTRVSTSLRGFEAPVLEGDTLTWSSSSLHVHGAWSALVKPVAATLLASDEGSVEWHCLQPASLAALRVGGGSDAGEPSRAVGGLGYAEVLTLTVPPWRMPIDELHWGRFVSELDDAGAHASLVWIDWRGAHARKQVYLDGNAVDADVSAERVAIAGGTTLSLDRRDVLREGVLGATVLAAVPELGKRVPGRLLGVHERKWRSRGVLERRDRRPVEGWAIHEVVRWP
jgi:hypothetical protein